MDKKWIFLFVAVFVIFPMLKITGGWAFFWLPFVFFMFVKPRMHRHHSHGEWYENWGCDSNKGGDYRKSKPKREYRDYIETVDGEYFEVVDEPRRA